MIYDAAKPFHFKVGGDWWVTCVFQFNKRVAHRAYALSLSLISPSPPKYHNMYTCNKEKKNTENICITSKERGRWIEKHSTTNSKNETLTAQPSTDFMNN